MTTQTKKGSGRARTSEPSAVCRAYYDAAMRYLRAAPWRFVESMDPFAVFPPGASEPLVVTVMGAGGEEYGLGVYRGEGAFDQILAMMRGEGGEAMASEVDALSCMLELYGRMPPQVRTPISRAGARPKRDAPAPWAIAKRPFKHPANPSDADLELLTTLMDTVLVARERGLLPLGKSFESALRAERCPEGLVVTVEPFSPPSREEQAPPVLMIDAEALAKLPIMDAVWHVGCPAAPVSVGDMEDEIRMLFAVAEPNGIIIGAEMIHGERALAMAAFGLIGLFSKCKGIPRTLVFMEHELRDALAPHLESRGIECVLTDTPSPLLAEAVGALFGHLFGGGQRRSRSRK
jgi:hypothetical protein